MSATPRHYCGMALAALLFPGVLPAAPSLDVLFAINSRWEGGYGATVTVKNLSGATLPAGAAGWKATLKFPDAATAHDVFASGPWNFQAGFADDGTVTLSPASWAAALPPGATTLSGFNGGVPAHLAQAVAADASVKVEFDSSVSTGGSGGSGDSGGNTGGGGGGSPGTPVDTTPRPTGSPAALLFGPYKDVGISMNWNTNVMSSAVTGTLKPLLAVLPARAGAVTWAFATGECGAENWAGLAPDALAAANVPLFVAAKVDYVISTGGAAGVFTCASADGMRAFINRYASARLVGLDFDIEAGQSVAAIDSLVEQLAAVRADYPKLRFSFTLATLGSSTGQAASYPYGDLNATGYAVIQAIQRTQLTGYTINLMVMDYGNPSAAVCVVKKGLCDMGQTAIQAAQNLNAKFGIPYANIELTPMIGMNDVANEVFSLKNTDTLVQWVKANGLAGVHFWSFDRDTPCNDRYASPTCSSTPTVPVLGYTKRFRLRVAAP